MGGICQIGIPPSPAFKASFDIADAILLASLLIGVLLSTGIASKTGSNWQQWFGPGRAVIVVLLLSLCAALP